MSTPKLLSRSKSSCKREVYSDKCLCYGKRKISNKQSNFIPQGTRKRRTKPKDSRRKEVTNVRTEMNEIENRKQHKSSTKLRTGF